MMAVYCVSLMKAVTLRKYVKVGAASVADAEAAATDIANEVSGFWDDAEVLKNNVNAFTIHEDYASDKVKA